MADLAGDHGDDSAATNDAHTGDTGGGNYDDRPPRELGVFVQENNGNGGGGGMYSDELHSILIRTKFRTFYLDLKESRNGKFLKVSEKSRGGRKSTIMMDAEDVDFFLDALGQMKSKIDS